jgi:uncharacterized protein YgbK (DUF1537 family)
MKAWEKVVRREPVIVVSGSCSPVTAGQIDYALANGFADVPLVSHMPTPADEMRQTTAQAAKKALLHLTAGRSVVVHTTRGPDDPRPVANVRSAQHNTAEVLGSALGQVLTACVLVSGPLRVCVAGGDTASYAARAIGIDSLEMIAPFTRGAPLCRIRSKQPKLDGVEAVFKAGQVGGPDLFVRLMEGAV